MAEVIQSTSTIGGATSLITGTAEFFMNAWPFLLGAVIVMILGCVVYFLLQRLEEERKERDEPGYQRYKNIVRSCLMGCKKEKIRKSWRLINLLWFGIPIIKKDHSAKIRDIDSNTIGYYRGEFKSMDNTYNFLCYKRKRLLFIEDRFIIKAPIQIKFKTPMYQKTKNGVIPVYDTDKQGKKIPRYEDKILSFGNRLKDLPNGDIQISCIDIEKLGTYYYCPVYPVTPGKLGYIDYRLLMEGAIADNTYQVMVQRILNVGAKQAEQAIMLNPQLQYTRKSPEKTKEEERLDQV